MAEIVKFYGSMVILIFTIVGAFVVFCWISKKIGMFNTKTKEDLRHKF